MFWNLWCSWGYKISSPGFIFFLFFGFSYSLGGKVLSLGDEGKTKYWNNCPPFLLVVLLFFSCSSGFFLLRWCHPPMGTDDRCCCVRLLQLPVTISLRCNHLFPFYRLTNQRTDFSKILIILSYHITIIPSSYSACPFMLSSLSLLIQPN